MLAARGIRFDDVTPWYFPSEADYRAMLSAHGFEPRRVELFDRPTPIPGAIADWLNMFGDVFLQHLPPEEREPALEELTALLQPRLCDAAGQWTVDYRRLRLATVKR